MKGDATTVYLRGGFFSTVEFQTFSQTSTHIDSGEHFELLLTKCVNTESNIQKERLQSSVLVNHIGRLLMPGRALQREIDRREGTE